MCMINSFANEDTRNAFNAEWPRKWPTEIQRPSLRKLTFIDNAKSLEEIRSVPGNRLEKLSGSREGQWSIRVNAQWRICFIWTEDNNAEIVELVDYH